MAGDGQDRSVCAGSGSMTPEEKSNEVREIVWEMSSITNKILILGIILVIAIYYYFSHG